MANAVSDSAAESGSVRWLALTSLVIAGEGIFLLPFVLSRIFRPTFLDIFGVSNLQLGTAFSLYGTVAMISYFAGGPLADRFPARRLIVAALIGTSLGGLLMITIPPVGTLTLLYGFWGLTTIFLFWAALIRATRELGGGIGQGKAFGFLDGGRGLFAALVSSGSVIIFAALLPQDVESATFAQRADALKAIIMLFAALGLGAAVLVWLFIPETPATAPRASTSLSLTLAALRPVLSMPTVWLQALIILCAYVAYKSTDDFSLYAADAFGYNDVEAARVGTVSFWMRPFAAVAAGLLADRFNGPRILLFSFAAVITGSAMISAGLVPPGLHWMLVLTVAGTSAGIYALRGLYFAIFREARVPLAFTGSAVGLVSFIGFTPDIFMGPLMGYLIDGSPGAAGHQHVFAVIALFGVIGFIGTLFFKKYSETTSLQMPGKVIKPI